MKTEELLLIGGVGIAAYFLYQQSQANAADQAATATTVSPGVTTPGVAIPALPVATTPASILTSAGQSVTNFVSSLTGDAGTAPAAATNVAASSVPAVIPPPPAEFDLTYYLTYQYPAMLAANPNVGNPDYVLTDPEATQYIANYAVLQPYPGDAQPLSSWKDGIGVAGVYRNPDTNNLINDKARLHWKLYGVARQYSFMPFTPWNNTPPKQYPPLPTTTAPKKSGNIFGDIVSGVAAVAPIAVALAGVDTLTERLDPREAGILITGGGLMMDVLSLYFGGVNGDQARDIYTEYHDLLTQYVK